METGNIISLDTLLYLKNAASLENTEENDKKDEYVDILAKISQIITNNHSSELAEVLYTDSATVRLKALINKYLVSEKLVDKNTGIGTLTDRIYQDMAGISFIKKYLDDPDVEEININGKNGIWVVYNGSKKLIPESFNSATECISIIKKMARMGNLILDGSAPYGDSYLKKGVRISAAIDPVTDQECGGIASIRKQKPAYITREKLLEFETASEDELDFLSLCINNGVSVAIAGETGSGKTADMNYLLTTIPNKTRIITIEDTKELQIEKYEHGKKINDVVQLYTKEPPQEVTMDDVLKLCLRLHPAALVPSEMRGAEAKTAVEAGRTGHVIISCLHANSAVAAYDRILTMYLMGGSNLSEDRILRMIIEAFPIVLYKKQLRDRSRKYIEIFEATDIINGKVVGNFIFKFIPEKTLRNDGEIIKIEGKHEKVGSLSPRLVEILRLNGVESSEIKRFGEVFGS